MNEFEFMTIKSLEHAYGTVFTPSQIESILKELNNKSVDRDGEITTPPRSKI
jgi:hypothetical protein